jgi:hypothetical protein
MIDALSQEKVRLSGGLNGEPPVVEPLVADQWVVNSLLQKSIRRSKVEVAKEPRGRSWRKKALRSGVAS